MLPLHVVCKYVWCVHGFQAVCARHTSASHQPRPHGVSLTLSCKSMHTTAKLGQSHASCSAAWPHCKHTLPIACNASWAWGSHRGDVPYLTLDHPKTRHSGPTARSQRTVKVNALHNAQCQGMLTHQVWTWDKLAGGTWGSIKASHTVCCKSPFHLLKPLIERRQLNAEAAQWNDPEQHTCTQEPGQGRGSAGNDSLCHLGIIVSLKVTRVQLAKSARIRPCGIGDHICDPISQTRPSWGLQTVAQDV